MLPAVQMETMEREKRKLLNEKKLHLENGQCSGDNCKECKRIEQEIKQIESIQNDSWSSF